jgi:hypothetical protein
MAANTEARATNRTHQNAPDLSPTAPDDDARTILINEINWGAVFAGAALALSAQLILNMLGLALGLSAFSLTDTNNPDAETFSASAAAWWAISGIIASFLGGVAAGRLSGSPKHTTAGWHGLTSWAFTTLAIFYLIGSTAGAVVGTATSAATVAAGAVARTAGGAVQTAAQVAAPSLASTNDPFSSIEQSVRGAGQDPAAMRDAAVAAVRAALTSDPADAEQARTRAADALAKAQNIPPDQARAQLAQYESQYRQAVGEARRQATVAAERTRETVASGSFWAALALLIGAVAAWFGGRAGVVDPTMTSLRAALLRTRQ